MLDKYMPVPGVDPLGNVSARIIEPESNLVKVASGVHQPLLDKIAKLEPAPGKVRALVGCQGASEYWGINLRADWWPEKEIAHPGQEYGHETFLNARLLAHHKNKPWHPHMGKLLFTGYNTDMHRIELVLEADEELCRQHRQMEMIHRLRAGEPVDFSMGARVQYDECSICGHKIYNQLQERCRCMREMQGKVLSDGRVVCMINYKPRGFDFSVVNLRADNQGFTIYVQPGSTLGKVASVEDEPANTAEPAAPSTPTAPLVEKVAAAHIRRFDTDVEKLADHEKLADLIKRFRTLPHSAVNVVEKALPRVPAKQLMSEDPRGLISASVRRGMPLLPDEFQRVALRIMRHGAAAEPLADRGITFRVRPPGGSMHQMLRGGCGPDNFGALEHVRRLVDSSGDLVNGLLSRAPVDKIVISIGLNKVSDVPLLAAVSGLYQGYLAEAFREVHRQIALDAGLGKTAGFGDWLMSTAADTVRAMLSTSLLSGYAKEVRAEGGTPPAWADIAQRSPVSTFVTTMALLSKVPQDAKSGPTGQPREAGGPSYMPEALFGPGAVLQPQRMPGFGAVPGTGVMQQHPYGVPPGGGVLPSLDPASHDAAAAQLLGQRPPPGGPAGLEHLLLGAP